MVLETIRGFESLSTRFMEDEEGFSKDEYAFVGCIVSVIILFIGFLLGLIVGRML